MGDRGTGSKRFRTRAVEYAWADGEDAVFVTFTTDTEPAYPSCFAVPATRLHKYLALTLEGHRTYKATAPHIEISLDDTEDDTLFEYVKQADVNDTRQEQDEDDDDADVDNRSEVLEELAEWAATTLDGWKSAPAVAVKIVGFLKMHKDD